MGALSPGLRETDVLAEAEYAMRKAGAEGWPFRAQVLSGDRTLLTHPYATSSLLGQDQIVVIHLGASVNGYCSKMCRTAALGRIPDAQSRVYRMMVEAQRAAISELRPGTRASEVDAAARAVIEAAGFGESFVDDIGYGIGLRQSEPR